MTQPTPYAREFSFAGWSASSPNTPQPGFAIDNELDGIATTLSDALGNLALIQRDDGRLANGSVGVSQFDAMALALLGSKGLTVRGPWSALRAYDVGDIFSVNNAVFLVMTAHTSNALLIVDITAGRVVGPILATVNPITDTKFGVTFTAAAIEARTPGVIMARAPAGLAWLIPAGMPHSAGKVANGPTVATVFDLQVNGASVGSARFAAGATTPTFIKAGDTGVSETDWLDLIAPPSFNGMSGAFGLTIMGSK